MRYLIVIFLFFFTGTLFSQDERIRVIEDGRGKWVFMSDVLDSNSVARLSDLDTTINFLPKNFPSAQTVDMNSLDLYFTEAGRVQFGSNISQGDYNFQSIGSGLFYSVSVDSDIGLSLENDVQEFRLRTSGTNQDRFEIQNVTSGTTPFSIETGGGDNALRINEDGEVVVNSALDAGNYQFQVNGEGYLNGSILATGEGRFGNIGDQGAYNLQVSGQSYFAGNLLNNGGDIIAGGLIDNGSFPLQNNGDTYFGGTVGLGTTSATHGLDLVDSEGVQFRLRSNETDATLKRATIDLGHYTNAEEDFGLIFGESNATDNILGLGGGGSLGNSATQIRFYASSSPTLLQGTEVARFNSQGELLLGTTTDNGAYILQLQQDARIEGSLDIVNGTIVLDPGGNITTSNVDFRDDIGTFQHSISGSTGEVYFGTTTDWGDFTLQSVGNTYLAGQLRLGNNADQGGQTLQVNGDAYVDGSVDIVEALNVQQGAVIIDGLALNTVTTGDNPNINFIQGRVATTDATPTTLLTIPIAANRTYSIKATIIARRTGGTAGTIDDGGIYELQRGYTTKSGTVTALGGYISNTFNEDQPGWDASYIISGSNVLLQVTGAANNNITWHGNTEVSFVGS